MTGPEPGEIPPVPRSRERREILPDHVDVYLARLAVQNLPPVMEQLHAEAARRAFPIVGPEVGRLFLQLARLHRPHRVLELGSGFDYSAIWWALGAPDAEIHCTEYRDEHIALGRRFAADAGVADRLHWHQGEALALAESLPGPWDLVFCDVDKKDYPRAFALAAERLAPGGMLVFDNALRNGDVALAPERQTPPVAAVVELTRMLYADARFDVSLLPVRDGVLLALLRDGA